jgi:predicted N-formylglutamate amidohydrolase
VARGLADRLDAPLILAGYSRLVIDPNRHPGSPTSVPLASEDVVIPGNHDLSPQQRQAREQTFFWSYHDTIAAAMSRFRQRERTPALVSIHSFTPAFLGRERPWHVGVLWHQDGRIARPLIKRLNAEPDLCVGDNEPYSARNPEGYTMEMHAEQPGVPGVLIEIRQDLISSPDGVDKWQARLGLILAEILADESMYYLEPRQNA